MNVEGFELFDSEILSKPICFYIWAQKLQKPLQVAAGQFSVFSRKLKPESQHKISVF